MREVTLWTALAVVAGGLLAALTVARRARRHLGTTSQRAAYEARWEAAQEQFIDNPRQATQTAAGLVTAVAAEIGYPVGDREQLLADLSVNHGQYLAGYRGAVRATDQAADGSTEEFRQALLDYRRRTAPGRDSPGATRRRSSSRPSRSFPLTARER